jgi:branched-chain amino acid transport system permease protein
MKKDSAMLSGERTVGARIARVVPSLLGVAAVLAALWFVDGLLPKAGPATVTVRIANICGLAVIMAVSLNLINGICGQFSLGHHGFMAAGAYASAAFVNYVGASVLARVGLPPVYESRVSLAILMTAGMLSGAIVAGTLGFLIGLPSLRLRGDYLAIATLGFAEIVRVVILNINAVGGAAGYSTESMASFFWIWGVAFLTIVVCRNILFSTHGRALQSVREDEVAAEAMGIDTARAKVSAFTTGAIFAGVAGSLYAHFDEAYISPEDFNFIQGVFYVMMVVLAGRGSITGSILGAVIIRVLEEWLRTFVALPPVKLILGENAAMWRMVVYPMMLILLMLTRPQGMLGTKELSLRGLYRWLKTRRRRVAAA